MFAYCLLLAVPFFVAAVLRGLKQTYRLKEIPYQDKIMAVFFLMYFLLLVLRSPSVGADVRRYLYKFNGSADMSMLEYVRESSWELGFDVLTKIIRWFTSSQRIFLTVLAALALWPLARFYSKESEDPVLSIAIFVVLPMFAMFFSGLRQAISMAMVVPAYRFVREKKLFFFLLVVLLASLFHSSAVVMVLIYPVYYANWTKRDLLWLIPGILIAYIFNGVIFRVALRFLFTDSTEVIKSMGSTGAVNMLIFFSLFLIFSYVFLDKKQADRETMGLRNILVLSVVIQCFAGVHTLVMRLNYYFLLFLPLLIPRVIRRTAGSKRGLAKFAGVVICLFCVFYFLRQVYNQDSILDIYPYIPFWKDTI